jgi:hypothetical protein
MVILSDSLNCSEYLERVLLPQVVLADHFEGMRPILPTAEGDGILCVSANSQSLTIYLIGLIQSLIIPEVICGVHPSIDAQFNGAIAIGGPAGTPVIHHNHLGAFPNILNHQSRVHRVEVGRCILSGSIMCPPLVVIGCSPD